MATASPHLMTSPQGSPGTSPTPSHRGRGRGARGRGPLPTPPSQGTSKPVTWASAPTSWSRRAQEASPTTSTSSSSTSGAITYPANTYPSSSLGSTPSKISALTAKFESHSTRSPSPPASPPSSSPSASARDNPPPSSVRGKLGRRGKPWKDLPPPPALLATDPHATSPAASSPPPAPTEEFVNDTSSEPAIEEAPPTEDAAVEVACSLCDQAFVYPTHTACPMCGEEYADASMSSNGHHVESSSSSSPSPSSSSSAEQEGPRQVECALCDHPYVYPTQTECPMCGEPFGAADEPPAPAAAALGPSASPAPGTITAMLMQLQQNAQAQQQQQTDGMPDIPSQQLEDDEDVASRRPKSIEEEAKRIVMCGHCSHTYEYPTFNFCDNCGHPSSNASLRLSQIKRTTWAQGRQSMQIGAGAMEQMLAAAAATKSGPAGSGPTAVVHLNYCPDCGTSTDGGNQRFCGMCGKSFSGDEPALPEFEDLSSPTTSYRGYETGERDKLKKKNKSWGKKSSYRTYFKEMSNSPITARVRKLSKRVANHNNSTRTIEVRGDWQHTISAALPSTPDAIAAYKQMMIAKYEAQQKENVFIRSNSRRGSSEFHSLDTASLSAFQQGVSEDGSLSPRGGGRMYHHQPQQSPRGVNTSYRSPQYNGPILISSPSATFGIAVGHSKLDEQIASVLAGLNLAKYGTAFAQEEINYEAFLMLEADDLAQMGIPIGPRKLIFAKIVELKQQ